MLAPVARPSSTTTRKSRHEHVVAAAVLREQSGQALPGVPPIAKQTLSHVPGLPSGPQPKRG